MEIVSERVSIDRADGRISVVISARASRWKEALLVAWMVAWMASGITVAIMRATLPEGDPKRQYWLVFLAFWAYFLVRIGRAVLWRLKGFELWRLKDGVLTIKDSILGYGRATNYFVENIRKLGAINVDHASFRHQLNEAAWTIGGERLGFEHLGAKVVFGKGLNEVEARRLLHVLQEALREARRKVAAQ